MTEGTRNQGMIIVHLGKLMYPENVVSSTVVLWGNLEET